MIWRIIKKLPRLSAKYEKSQHDKSKSWMYCGTYFRRWMKKTRRWRLKLSIFGWLQKDLILNSVHEKSNRQLNLLSGMQLFWSSESTSTIVCFPKDVKSGYKKRISDTNCGINKASRKCMPESMVVIYDLSMIQIDGWEPLQWLLLLQHARSYGYLFND